MVARTELVISLEEILSSKHIASRASSRTLTPVGARLDSDGDSDINSGVRTPTQILAWSTFGAEKEKAAKANFTANENSEECKLCDTGDAKHIILESILAKMKHENPTSNSIAPLALGPMKTTMTQAEPAPSIGSMGHPFTCRSACRYYRRKEGCRDGFNCVSCHLCHWSRVEIQKPVQQDATPLKIAIPDPSEDDTPPSTGSIGHPTSCQTACKYNRKSTGCKDGKQCVRCHLCRWTRCAEKMKNVPTHEESQVTPSERRVQNLPKELRSPRRVEIQGSIGDKVPMYITLNHNCSF